VPKEHLPIEELAPQETGLQLPSPPATETGAVKTWDEPVTLLTYTPARPDVHPLFLESRHLRRGTKPGRRRFRAHHGSMQYPCGPRASWLGSQTSPPTVPSPGICRRSDLARSHLPSFITPIHRIQVRPKNQSFALIRRMHA
jgi:hypothetical protein